MSDLQPVSALAHRRNGQSAAVMISPMLTVREVPGLALFHLTVDFARSETLRAAAEAALGTALPEPRTPSSGNAIVAIWQMPADILFAGAGNVLAPITDALRKTLGNGPAILDDVTHSMTVIDLEGQAAQFICSPQSGKSNVGRLADLRVTQLFVAPGHIRLFVDYPDADYLWSWLEARLPALNAA